MTSLALSALALLGLAAAVLSKAEPVRQPVRVARRR